MGQNNVMPQMSKMQGKSSHQDTPWDFCDTRRPFRPRPQRHRGPPPSIRRTFIPPHVRRSLHKMARGLPHGRHFSRDGRRVFITHWVALFGAPSTITTDRGRQFESHLFHALATQLGTTRIRTMAYHPVSNGLVERLHRQLKSSLMTHDGPRWTETLPLVLLGIRTAVKADLGCPTAELVYGTTLRLPGQFVAPATLIRLTTSTDYANSCTTCALSRLAPNTNRLTFTRI